MGRTINLTGGSDRLQQSQLRDNIELIVRAFGGNDTIIFDRTDDLGGGNTLQADGGNDTVLSSKEFGNRFYLGSGDDTYYGLGFSSFASEPPDRVFGDDGNDRFFVQTFGSIYAGGNGNDTFHSVGWANSFFGGAGTDTIDYTLRADDSVLGRQG